MRNIAGARRFYERAVRGSKMRTGVNDRNQEAESLSLEAEAAAWRSKRAGRPDTVAGKVPVVRIRRRARPGSWQAPASRPLAAAPR